MGAPTVYSWDDPSAPVFRSGPNGLYDILKGCLVDGYSGKAAAGWSVVYDDWFNTGNVSFANAAQSGVLGLWHPMDSYLDYGPMMYVAEGMASASQPLNGRSAASVITDTSEMTYADAVGSTWACHMASYARVSDGMQWVIVANENAAIVFLDRASTGESGLFHGSPQSYFQPGTYRPDMLFFGALNTSYGLGSVAAPELGNFFIIGGTSGSPGGFSVDWSGSALRASHTRYTSGGLVASVRYARMAPMSGLSYPAGDVFELELRPWRAYIGASSGGPSFSGLGQYGRVPGLFSFADIGRFRDQDDFDFYHRGSISFKDITMVAGRAGVYGCFGGANHAFVSVEESDW